MKLTQVALAWQADHSLAHVVCSQSRHVAVRGVAIPGEPELEVAPVSRLPQAATARRTETQRGQGQRLGSNRSSTGTVSHQRERLACNRRECNATAVPTSKQAPPTSRAAAALTGTSRPTRAFRQPTKRFGRPRIGIRRPPNGVRTRVGRARSATTSITARPNVYGGRAKPLAGPPVAFAWPPTRVVGPASRTTRRPNPFRRHTLEPA